MVTKSADTLVADIYKLLDGADLTSAIERFKDDIGAMMLRRFAERAHEREPTLRMSNVGKPLRQLWYELNGYKQEPLEPETKFKFLYGDLIECLVLFLAEASGHTVECLQESVEVDGVLGHIDAVIDGVLFDVKSCSSYSFDKFKEGTLFENDPFGYIGQLSGYAKAKGLEEARFLAVDKVRGHLCTLTIPKDIIDGYDIRRRITDVRQSLSGKDEPDFCYPDEPDGKSGNRKLSIPCSYCGFKSHCWRDANGGEGLKVFLYSTGPRFLTNVARQPRTFEVISSA